MRSEPEVRKQYEFLKYELDSEEIRHEGVGKLTAYHKRVFDWVLEEEHMWLTEHNSLNITLRT